MRLVRVPGVTLACVFITGCATLPEFEEDHVTTAMVIQNIKCEFRDAAWQKNPANKWLKDWNGVFVLTLSLNQKGSAAIDATIVHPLTAGNFTLPFGFGGTGEATRTEKIEFKDSIEALNKDTKLDCPAEEPNRRRHSMLAGRIGIGDLLDRTREAAGSARFRPSQLDYTLVFRIVKNANIGPRFNLIPFGSDTLSVGLKLDGSRERTHTLNITLKEKVKDPPCPYPELAKQYKACPIFVVNLPVMRKKPADDKEPAASGTPFGDRSGRQPAPEILDDLVKPGATQRGLSREDRDSLDRGLGRSILQDTLEELRRKGLTTQ